MRLFPLSPPDSRLSINLMKLSRRYRIHGLTSDGTNYSDSIAITNGTPDDIVIGLLSNIVNGVIVTSIFKSIHGRHGFFDEVINHVGPRINNIIVFMDQEDEELSYIYRHVERKLREKGCMLDEELIPKVRRYSCSAGPHRFNVLLVVNGLNNIETDKHSIEDHLILAAGIECTDNSKNTWRQLSNEQKNNIFRRLTNSNRDTLYKYFPQQVEALEYLYTSNLARA